MSMWILHLPPEPPAELPLGNNAEVALPLPPLPDFTRTLSQDDLKRKLRMDDASLTPEAANRQAALIWRCVRAVEPEDIIAVPLPEGKRIAFAEVTARPRFMPVDGARGRYMLPVRWRPRTASTFRFRKFREEFDAAPDAVLTPIHSPRVRLIIRDCLRLPGSRFAKWAWVLALLFLMRIVHLALRAWRMD